MRYHTELKDFKLRHSLSTWGRIPNAAIWRLRRLKFFSLATRQAISESHCKSFASVKKELFFFILLID